MLLTRRIYSNAQWFICTHTEASVHCTYATDGVTIIAGLQWLIQEICSASAKTFEFPQPRFTLRQCSSHLNAKTKAFIWEALRLAMMWCFLYISMGEKKHTQVQKSNLKIKSKSLIIWLHEWFSIMFCILLTISSRLHRTSENTLKTKSASEKIDSRGSNIIWVKSRVELIENFC